MTQQSYLSRESISTSEPARMPRWWTIRKFESALDTLVRTSWRVAPRDFPFPEGMRVCDVYGRTVGEIDHGPFHIEWDYALNGGFTYKSRITTVEAHMKDGSTVVVLDHEGGGSELAKDSPVWSAFRSSLQDIATDIEQYSMDAKRARIELARSIDNMLG